MTVHDTRTRNMPRFCKTGTGVQTHLRGIANKARKMPKYKFRNLYGMIDMELLRLAWRKLNKRAASGVDRVSAEEYAKNLDANLDDLIDRLKNKRYRAKLIKRRYIPKSNGKKRPLGIPAVEDRLLQKAVAMILEAIYEPDFLDSSYGYRPGRNAEGAVKSLKKALHFEGYGYVVEADIKGFFDNLDQKELIVMLKERIDDKNLLRLIQKWLRVGILEPDGKVINPLMGTPQGGIVSPILANVYLHYVLDKWVETEVRPYSKEGVKYIRYADDFVCAFKNKHEAETFYEELPKRLGRWRLELAEEKTRILKFGWMWGKESRRFDFLGFELSWQKSRKGMPNVMRRTARPKLRQTLKDFGEWFKANRSKKLNQLIDELNAQLKGYYGYYGVIGNSKSLGELHYQLCRLLFKWLNKRSQKKSMNWTQFGTRIRPRLLNPRISEQRILQRELPGIRC